jgi:hypothetical protein
MLRVRLKTRPRTREKDEEVKRTILRDLRRRPGEYVEGFKVPKGGE